MIRGKGRTSGRTLDIFYGGINSDVNRMESTLKALELYSLGLLPPLLSEIDVYFIFSFHIYFLLCFSCQPYKAMSFMC